MEARRMPSDTLLELIASVMEVDVSQVDEDSNYESLAKWDSMRQIMLASVLESEYGFTLGVDEMLHLQSVASIRAILRTHGIPQA
jgi:acyl carrier protein